MIDGVGKYEITFSVVDSTNTSLQSTSILSIVENEEATYEVELVGNNPIYVQQNDGTIEEDILEYINAFVSVSTGEVIADSEIEIVSDGGYNNSVGKAYTFKLRTIVNGHELEALITFKLT